jgi:hypothetical protein
MSKYSEHLKKILDLRSKGMTNAEIASQLRGDLDFEVSHDTLRKQISRMVKGADDHTSMVAFAEANGVPSDNVSSYWYKGDHFSLHVKNNSDEIDWMDIRDSILESMKGYVPKYPGFSYSQVNDGHCLVVDPADIHIGKLSMAFETGESYDSSMAVKRVIDGVEGIINKSYGFNIEQIVFVAGNDVLHIDSPRRTTTSGTPQDTDGMWFSNFLLAKQLYIDVIETLLGIAPVHFMFNPSNHDYTHGFFLCDIIATWFSEEPNMTFDTNLSHRKYYKYGNNLIGTTHGDGAKMTDLPILMATEAALYWAQTEHRYVYTHHVHHKTSKDFPGVTVESLRSPSGTDSWHHRNGYQHAPKAVEGFIHHPKHGQVARITHLF